MGRNMVVELFVTRPLPVSEYNANRIRPQFFVIVRKRWKLRKEEKSKQVQIHIKC